MDLKDKSLLITGGSGSFGHAYAEHLLNNTDVGKIVIFSRDEYKQFRMKEKFAAHDHRMRYFIGDVRDAERLSRSLYGIDYVVHAAAMKQVPACEYNPIEAVKTNIHGAENVINAAFENSSVETVIALSTDKAVNPINLYGGTKLVSDKLFAAANNHAGGRKTKFALVRYGNVAGSRGSVIPFFRAKINGGGQKLPLTDEEMTRFWMTLDKAVALVNKAFDLAQGGETFVYKNPSFYVADLIKAMNPDDGYDVIGVREGEKIHECMITHSDSMSTWEYDDYYVIYPIYSWWGEERLIPGGRKVEPGWAYTSDKNDWWLGLEELITLLPEVK
ncbi:MAG: UDP-N-acetylglucosamine 4,6-dehydratase (inverting) [Clostridiales Family XIII bacterium]|jgi:UDP-N-acetylglucosamine 4,6-dehydratase (inverting)|nr:UDP-N-acetylglucosamine 4,6-dehydratase (inverting) [Clostridiales Family XIII bacterium]